VPQLTELDLTRIVDASKYPTVVHGTYYRAWESIKASGLNVMGRNFIHFAKGEYGSAGVISGQSMLLWWSSDWNMF